jgi:nucleotide-binding universal stress UspA family protein
MLPIRTVLYPSDFSESSNFAFPLACTLARDYDARLVVAHVADRIMPSYTRGEIIPLPELVPRDPKVRVEHRLAAGDAATEILRLAKETQADVIVMGTHGRTGLARVLMGSVAEQIVRKAPCPVVTVKIPLRRVQPAQQPAPEKAKQPVMAADV